jgi:2'-5' RNA ligase
VLREPVFEPVEADGDPDELLADTAAASLMEAATAATKQGAMVALFPDAATAAELAIADGEDADELHVTLAFLGKAADLDLKDALRVVATWAAKCPEEMRGEISGVGQFIAGPVTYLSVDLPDLPPLRQELVDTLDQAGLPPSRDHGFTPHMTLDYARRRPNIEKPIPVAFSRVTLAWGGDRYSFALGGSAAASLAEALMEGKWDPTLHPRWPKGTPKAGEFIKVGETFISGDGKEWQVAHLAGGKVIANRIGKSFKDAETGVFSPSLEGGKAFIADAKKEGKPVALKSDKAKGIESGVATVDPYVDPTTHDPSIAIPAHSKIKPEEWQRFGSVDQEHYAELMQRFGKYSPGKAKDLIDESYKDYEATIQSIVKNAYSAQYGSSSGFTLSLASMFKAFKGGKTELGKLDEQRKLALALQGRHKDIVAWDLYNRTRSPDVAVFHKNTNAPSYWQAMIDGKKPIMSGLSQSFNFGANFQFGNNTLATPLAIRHVLMSSYSAQPIPGQTHFVGELEISVAEQIKIDKRSMYFSLYDITENQKKWLMGVTKAPSGGATIERFRDAIENGEMLPTPPAPPDVQMQGQAQKLWIDPPAEAAEFSARFADKLPSQQSKPWTPAELDKSGPWAFKNADGTPKATVAKESELKPGDYMMGLKGTLYLIVEDPGDDTGFGLRYVKIENGKFTGESYNFEGGGQNQYFKLSEHYDLPDPHKLQAESELFDPNAWVNGTGEKFTGQMAEGEKFKVNGNPYEVKAQINGAKTQILDLMTGKVGTINTDYKTPTLVAKEGYVPDEEDVAAPQLTPQKGMTLPYQGKKHTITKVLKDGTIKAKPSGGKVVAISPDDEALADLYDPQAHKIGSKIKVGDLAVGDLFHGGRGQSQRPYLVTGTEGNKVLWKNLDTGEAGVSTKSKVVRRLLDAEASPAPDEPKNTPKSADAPFSADDYVPGAELQVADLEHGDKFVDWTGNVYEAVFGDPNASTEPGKKPVKNLASGDVTAYPDDAKVTELWAKNELGEKAIPHDQLKPEDSTTLSNLEVGDYFKDGGELFKVQAKGGPEDNLTVAMVQPSGHLSASETAWSYPDKPITFIGKNPAIHAESPAPSSSGMPSHVEEGGFEAYISKHGSGGKYTHDKIGDMPVGTIFRGKEGKLWKVKANDGDVIVTDGQLLYSADPKLRGRAVTADFNDATGPLPGPGTDPGQADAAKGLLPNSDETPIGKLPVGTKVTIAGYAYTVGASKGKHPEDAVVEMTDPDGAKFSVKAELIPDKVKLTAKGDDELKKALASENIESIHEGETFFGNDLKDYTVIAKSLDGVVLQDAQGNFHKAPPGATTSDWPLAPAKPAAGVKPMPGEFVVSDLKPGEKYTTTNGANEVVAHTVDGNTIIKDEGGSLNQLPSTLVLKDTQKLDPTAALQSQWSPDVEKVLAEAGQAMDDVPTSELNGYTSKWGSKGKYMHYRLEELEPGAVITDKDGTIASVVGPGPEGKTLVGFKSGSLGLIDAKTRVKRIDG